MRHPTIICRGFFLSTKKIWKENFLILCNIFSMSYFFVLPLSSSILFSHSADLSKAERVKNVVEIWAAADSLRWLQPARDGCAINFLLLLIQCGERILAKIKKSTKKQKENNKMQMSSSPLPLPGLCWSCATISTVYEFFIVRLGARSVVQINFLLHYQQKQDLRGVRRSDRVECWHRSVQGEVLINKMSTKAFFRAL